MPTRDYRDIVGGLLLIVFGLAFTGYSAAHYALGTLRQMGPGMFPAGLGVVLALLGLLLFAGAMFRAGTVPQIRIWTPLFVLAGVVAFALSIRPLGLIPAVLAVTIISSFAELKIRPVSLGLLCLSLSLIAWVTFGLGLNLPIPMFRWPL